MADEERPYTRTPIITIELQLCPPPPEDAEPYWWGSHRLTFRRHGQPVWEAHIPEADWSKGRTAYVRMEHGYGWVLVLTLMHDDAKKILDGLALPYYAGAPMAADDKGHGHASTWSFWGHDDTDPCAPDERTNTQRRTSEALSSLGSEPERTGAE